MTTTKTKKTAGRKISNFTNAIHPRVTAKNAAFLRKTAITNNMSYSQIVDGLIGAFKSKTTFTITTATK